MIRSHKGVTPQVPDTSYVDDSAQIIGDVILGEHSSVWMNAVLRGDVHEIRVGHYSNIQDGCTLHGMKEKYGVHVGDSSRSATTPSSTDAASRRAASSAWARSS